MLTLGTKASKHDEEDMLGGDLVTALANLPAPPSPDTQTTTTALAATGTDDGPNSDCTLFAPDGVFDCHSVALNGTTDQGADTGATDHKSLDTASLGNDCHTMSSCDTEYAREGSNPQPADPKSAALSN